MKFSNKILERARLLSVRKKYRQAISLLEPQISFFRDDSDYFHLLGRAWFSVGNIENGELYLRKSLRCNRNNRYARHALAVLLFRRHEREKALKIWVELSADGPLSRNARRCIAVTRRFILQPQLYYDFIKKNKNIQRMLPPLRDWRQRIAVLARPAAAAAVAAAVFIVWRNGSRPEPAPERDGSALISLGDIPRSQIIDWESSGSRYELTAAEVEQSVELIREGFQNNDDNAIRPEINRLIYSNADRQIKQQMARLSGMLSAPEIFTIKERYGYRDIRDDPYLYENCYVLWQGRITNVREDPDRQRFAFLIGYTDGSLLEGTVEVELEKPVLISEQRSYELLGQVIRTAGESFRLDGVTLRPLPE